MDWNMLYSNVTLPKWEQVREYIGSPLWSDFNGCIQSVYQAGWNIKYKK